MAARPRADALHNPRGETVSPGSKPPSVQLEGEKNKATSLYVEAVHVEMNGNNAKVDNDELKLPRDPVGTQDGDERCPNEPTEPPDEEGARGGKGELMVESRVELVQSNESSRVDEPKGKGDKGADERAESRGVEGQRGGQNDEDGGHRDGRTNGMDGSTSSANRDSI
ncbi:hypothetical protein BDN67DRAFT_1016877 [Paxillus ammoniavirescens]|nr:hypothetical protein BDN67DRAFT_1016877 [Paxillus ammoniavirescens]